MSFVDLDTADDIAANAAVRVSSIVIEYFSTMANF